MLEVGSPADKVPTFQRRAHRVRYQSKTDAEIQRGVEALKAADDMKLLEKYEKVTQEFYAKATAAIRRKKEAIEAKVAEAGKPKTREPTTGTHNRSLRSSGSSESKRRVEQDEDETAIRASLESELQRQTAGKTPKKRRFRGSPLSAGLPSCGGSGSKASHAITFND